MIQKTFSLTPKVQKCVIFNLLSKTMLTASTSALTDAIHMASRVCRQKRSSRYTAGCSCDD